MADYTRALASPSKWAVTATATNLAAVATKSAIAKQRHYISGVAFSASGTVAAAVAVLVQDGSTTLVTVEVPATALAPVVMTFPKPLECSVNSAAQLTVPALGSGIVGAANIWGYTDIAD
jgi:hypothetical protein